MQSPRNLFSSFQLTPSFIWAATLVGLLLQFSFFTLVAFGYYKVTTEDVEKAADNIASLLESGLARDFELYDLSVRAVVEGMQDEEVMREPPRIRQITLFDRSSTAKGLGALVALDAAGNIILDSLGITPRSGNFADREYFQVHKKGDLGLYISRPFRARLQQDIWSISLSRRVNGPDGVFRGIVSGTLKLDYLRERFAKANVGAGGTISLLRDDGTLIVQNAAGRHEPGADWRSAPIMEHLSKSPKGTYWLKTSMDGAARVYAYRRIAGTPLVISVGLSSVAAMAPWWSTIELLVLAYVGMAAGVIGLVAVFVSELRKRQIAELAQANLARKDALTGLVNRLGFSEAMEKAWRIARRCRTPVSLLMLDLDYFKQFNDVCGHLEGDDALRKVGLAVSELTRRPNDIAARYGGEEIAILLPDTPMSGALAIAKLMRFAIEALAIRHPTSQHQVISASVGVATMVPSGEQPASLISMPDDALYRAKKAGRNCVMAAVDTPYAVTNRA